ncbi:hypothetical protein G9A89_004454 [Geosiphon pyriformis]|nr:hypothetical protein G9A89_004454 [Geosiphon pyriformis]
MALYAINASRIYFHVSKPPTCMQDSRRVFDYFAKKGELTIYSFVKSPDSKSYNRYGFLSFKDESVTKEVLDTKFHKVDFLELPIEVSLAAPQSCTGKKNVPYHLGRANPNAIWSGFYKDPASRYLPNPPNNKSST